MILKNLLLLWFLPICFTLAEESNSNTVSATTSDVADFAKPICLSIGKIQSGDHKNIQSIVSAQYWKAAGSITSKLDPKSSAADRIGSDFQGYKILGTDSVSLDNNAAVLVTKVQFDPKSLKQMKEDMDGLTDPAILFGSMGGMTYTNPFEEKGLGYASFYLVRQGGLWKIHTGYFSSKKMIQEDIKSVLQELNKISS
jgi:hypothetical protein